MTDEPFGQQPQLVRVHFHGSVQNVDYYMKWIKQVIENGSHANVECRGNYLTIYPEVVDD